MKSTIKLLTSGALIALIMFSFSACQKNNSNPTPREKKYTISPYGQSNISGTVNFKEILNVDSMKVTIQLQGVSQDGSYPVYFRKGTSIENGPLAFDLGFVDGKNPTLTKEINLSFDELKSYDGCIDIYRNPNDTVTIVAQSEIGANEVFKSYTMFNPLTEKANGQFRIYKRSQGTYFVIRIDTSVAHTGNTSHPARVYKADGTRDFDLNDLSPTTGVSATALSDHTFDELTHYDGTVKVLLSQDIQDVTLSKGDFKK